MRHGESYSSEYNSNEPHLSATEAPFMQDGSRIGRYRTQPLSGLGAAVHFERAMFVRILAVVALALAGGVSRAEDLSDLEKAYLGWTKDAEEIRQWQEQHGAEDRDQLRRDAREWSKGLRKGDVATESDPKPQKYAPKCMFGASGEVIHAPPGAECDPAHRSAAVSADEFRVPSVDPAAGWAPVRAGEEALYQLVHKSEDSRDGERFEEKLQRGTLHVAVLGDPGSPLEILSTSRLSAGRGQLEETKRESVFVLPSPEGSYRIQALRANLLGWTETVRFDPPVEFLPAKIARGVRWDAGAYSVEGIRYREEGEILGIQSAKTPAGLFEECLVVRHTGSMDGEFKTTAGGTLKVTESRIERTQWLARGVGPVLVKQTAYATIETNLGARLVSSVTTQAALVGVRNRPAAPASARARR